MSHLLHSRIICEATTRPDAMRVVERIARAFRLDPELSVCEPFAENPDLYDIVFRATLPSPPPADLMSYFEDLLGCIEGEWQEKHLAFYHGGRFQCSAVLDNYIAPKGGIAWMSLELQPAD